MSAPYDRVFVFQLAYPVEDVGIPVPQQRLTVSDIHAVGEMVKIYIYIKYLIDIPAQQQLHRRAVIAPCFRGRWKPGTELR